MWMRPTCRCLWRKAASHRLCLWGLPRSTWRAAAAAAASTTAASKTLVQEGRCTAILPDAVVDAWMHSMKQRDNFGCDLLGALPRPTAGSILSHIPTADNEETVRTADAGTVCADSQSEFNCAPAVTPSVAVGSIYDALHAPLCSENTPSHMLISLELVLAHLSHFAPLFVRLDATPSQIKVLETYCSATLEEKSAEDAPLCTNLYFRRLMRQTRASWQPWVSSCQKARLIAWGRDNSASDSAVDGEGETVVQPLLGGLTECGSASGGKLASSGERLPGAEQEHSWRHLLENVPSFFVSAKLVAADMRGRYGVEGDRLFESWVQRVPTSPAASVASAAQDRMVSRHRQDKSGTEGLVFLEVTADGRAVRAPSRETCLQSGCPPRLLYDLQHTALAAAVRRRYGLLQNTLVGAELMHAATSLLATSVPFSVACALSEARQLFTARQRDSAEAATTPKPLSTRDEEATRPTVNSATSCEAFFPCLEVLLDHPDLGFALQLHERVSGFTCASLPMAAGSPLGTTFDRNTENTVQVQLHPAFAHELRGAADVALAVLRQGQRRSNLCSDRNTVGGTVLTDTCLVSCAVHVHCMDQLADATPPDLYALLRRGVYAETRLCSTSAENDGVVCVFSGKRGDGTRKRAKDGAAQGLVLAFTCSPQRVDVVAVHAVCIPLLIDRVRSYLTMKDKGALHTAGSVTLLDACARLLSDTAVIRVTPSRFLDTSVCEADPLLQLWAVLPGALLASFCTLTHVAHYAGYPVGRATTRTMTSHDSDGLLAAVILRRHHLRLTTPYAGNKVDAACQQPEKSVEVDDVVVWEAAGLSVATLLLCGGREREASQSPVRCATATFTGESAASLSEALKTSAGSATAMRDYGARLRLWRYTKWLQTLEGDTSVGALPSAVPPSSAAVRVALHGLCAAYGPEPLPDMSWVIAPTLSAGRHTPVETAEVSHHHSPTDATAADAVSDANWSAAATGEARSTPSPAAQDSEQTDVDVLLYDALVSDAAASRAAQVRSPAPSPPHTTLDATATRASYSVARADPQQASMSPGGVSSLSSPQTAATAPTGQPEQDEMLDFYLATLLDSATTPATTMTAHSARDVNVSTSVADSVVQRPRTGACGDIVDVPPPPVSVAEPAPRQPPRSVRYGHPLPFAYPNRGRRGDHRRNATADGTTAMLPSFSPPQGTGGTPTRQVRHLDCTLAPPSESSWGTPTADVGAYTPPSPIPRASHSGVTSVALFNPFGPRAPPHPEWPPNPTLTAAPTLPPPPPPPPTAPPMPSAASGVALALSTPSAYAPDTALRLLGTASETERLRLASLILDIVRGTNGSSRRPPH